GRYLDPAAARPGGGRLPRLASLREAPYANGGTAAPYPGKGDPAPGGHCTGRPAARPSPAPAAPAAPGIGPMPHPGPASPGPPDRPAIRETAPRRIRPTRPGRAIHP